MNTRPSLASPGIGFMAISLLVITLMAHRRALDFCPRAGPSWFHINVTLRAAHHFGVPFPGMRAPTAAAKPHRKNDEPSPLSRVNPIRGVMRTDTHTHIKP